MLLQNKGAQYTALHQAEDEKSGTKKCIVQLRDLCHQTQSQAMLWAPGSKP
jgi:hypothetical protein